MSSKVVEKTEDGIFVSKVRRRWPYRLFDKKSNYSAHKEGVWNIVATGDTPEESIDCYRSASKIVESLRRKS